MKILRRLFHRLFSWTTAAQDEAILQTEIEEHIALQTADNLRAGLSPEEARRLALLKFGNVEAMKESFRDQKGLPLMEALLTDIRHALRRLRRASAFTAGVVLTLGARYWRKHGYLWRHRQHLDSARFPIPMPKDSSASGNRRPAYPRFRPVFSVRLPCISRIATKTTPSSSSDCGSPTAPASPGLPSPKWPAR